MRGWLLALLPALVLAVLMARAVWDVDIFWQLKLGELILAHGGPIALEPFSAKHLSDPLPALGWLGQAIMAAVRLGDAQAYEGRWRQITRDFRWLTRATVALANSPARSRVVPIARVAPRLFDAAVERLAR